MNYLCWLKPPSLCKPFLGAVAASNPGLKIPDGRKLATAAVPRLSMLTVCCLFMSLCLAYVFGARKDEVFLQLKALLDPFEITRFYTDGWGAYERHLEAGKHKSGKHNTQKIENKHLNLRTKIKRKVQKTICFSKTITMHDIVIGLFVNRSEFGIPI